MNQPGPDKAVCQCCDLNWPTRHSSPIANPYGLVRGYRCRMCNEHQGDPLKKALDHEDEVRKRWDETVDDWHQAEDHADEYKEKMMAAFRSRDAVLRHFERLADEVAPYHRATGHGCSCGDEDCEIPSIIGDPWINDLIRKMNKRS
jgi:hypothetical protein